MHKIKNYETSTINNPFIGDDLEMQSSVKNLIERFILEDISSKSVIGLNSSYGTGKSTFIKMSINYLKKSKLENILPVYVNVSENEFTSSPLLNILHSIAKEIGRKDTKYKEQILRPLLNVGIRIATMGALDISTIDKTFNSMSEKDIAGTTSNILDSILKEEDPKIELNTYLSKIAQDQKLVIFLDDIDRCSPSFAIKILEELKFHFASIDNMVFIIAYDRKQLESFIQSRFGNNIDCDGYLKKFFDYTFLLPSVDKSTFLLNTAKRCFTSINMRETVSVKLLDLVKHLISYYGPLINSQSLRNLQQDIIRLSLGLCKHNDLIYDKDTLCLLLFLRSKYWKLYSGLYWGQIKGIDLFNEIKNDIAFRDYIFTVSFANIIAYNTHDDTDTNIKDCISKLEIQNTNNNFSKIINNLGYLIEHKDINHDQTFIKKKTIKNPTTLIKDIFNILEHDETGR